MKKINNEYCCNDMMEKILYKCDVHLDPFDCPDNIIYKSKRNEYGIIIHGGGSSFIKINYCPWCGRKLNKN
jgi:hypothetical protein